MSTRLAKVEAFESLILHGDLSKLSSEERVKYHNAVCASVGLNPLTKPFEYITMNGKMVLYAKRDATDQLRKLHTVSIIISSRENINDVFVVTARASLPDGRTDESVGAVNIKGLAGDNLANAFMKAETKAKRRVTLSICGLGMLDETEVETVPGAKDVVASGKQTDAPNSPEKETKPVLTVAPPAKPTKGDVEVCACGSRMMVSKYGAEPRPWYCGKCKATRPRE